LGAGGTFAEGINNLGQVVGYYIDINGTNHGFLATPSTNIQLVSIASDGTQENGASSSFVSISGNGRYVAFQSLATNLVDGFGDTRDNVGDIFVYDRQAGTVEVDSVALGGGQPLRDGLSGTECTTLVELVLKEITDCLERGETVKLSSFGLFVVRKKGQRMGRNPKTGEEAPISPRRVVVFKPSEVLKQRINAPRSLIDGTWNKEGIGGDTSQ